MPFSTVCLFYSFLVFFSCFLILFWYDSIHSKTTQTNKDLADMLMLSLVIVTTGVFVGHKIAVFLGV